MRHAAACCLSGTRRDHQSSSKIRAQMQTLDFLMELAKAKLPVFASAQTGSSRLSAERIKSPRCPCMLSVMFSRQQKEKWDGLRALQQYKTKALR
jgi:hypothetical protein